MGTLLASYLMIGWGEGAWRQNAQNSLDDGGDLREGKLNLDGGLKVDADDGDALVAFAAGVLDVINRGGESALADGDDAAFHVLRGQAAVGPDDGDDGNVDVGVDVFGRGDGRADAEEQHEHGEDDKGVGSPKRQPDNPHAVLQPFFSSRGALLQRKRCAGIAGRGGAGPTRELP